MIQNYLMKIRFKYKNFINLKFIKTFKKNQNQMIKINKFNNKKLKKSQNF